MAIELVAYANEDCARRGFDALPKGYDAGIVVPVCNFIVVVKLGFAIGREGKAKLDDGARIGRPQASY